MKTLTHKQINTLIRRKFRCRWFDCAQTESFDDGVLNIRVVPVVAKFQTDAINKIQHRFSKYILEALLCQLCKEGKFEAGEVKIYDK